MVKHLSIKVLGKVQGVAYRIWAEKLAKSLEISGYAENLGDGSVQIEAEGEEKNLEKFIQNCHFGPTLAKVDKVEVDKGKWEGYSKFETK